MDKIDLNKGIVEIAKDNHDKCINCKKCYNVCPMMKDFFNSPKELMKDIYVSKKINKKVPYSCMLCGICNEVCPKNIDVEGMFYKIRNDLFENNYKEVKSLGYNSVRFHQANSFSKIFSSKLNKSSKRVFIPGCSLASYSSDIVKKTYEYLKNVYDDIELVVKCCGKPTKCMGDKAKFKNYYSQIEDMVINGDVEEIIVACPNCFETFKGNSKGVKVSTVWSVMKEFGFDNNLKDNYKDLELGFTIHDPCPMRHEREVQDDVREILKFLGLRFFEFNENREKSRCCGSGGMVRVTNFEVSVNQTKIRAESSKTENIICYCESCCESMMLANKKVLHVLDLIFDEDVVLKKRFNQVSTGVIDKWKMRYKTANVSKSLKGK